MSVCTVPLLDRQFHYFYCCSVKILPFLNTKKLNSKLFSASATNFDPKSKLERGNNSSWYSAMYISVSYPVVVSAFELVKIETFNLLGVTFSINLANMVDLNYSKRIEHIESLFKCYSKRFLTPVGKKEFGITKIKPFNQEFTKSVSRNY